MVIFQAKEFFDLPELFVGYSPGPDLFRYFLTGRRCHVIKDVAYRGRIGWRAWNTRLQLEYTLWRSKDRAFFGDALTTNPSLCRFLRFQKTEGTFPLRRFIFFPRNYDLDNGFKGRDAILITLSDL